jgi:hypothetical protein
VVLFQVQKVGEPQSTKSTGFARRESIRHSYARCRKVSFRECFGQKSSLDAALCSWEVIVVILDKAKGGVSGTLRPTVGE